MITKKLLKNVKNYSKIARNKETTKISTECLKTIKLKLFAKVIRRLPSKLQLPRISELAFWIVFACALFFVFVFSSVPGCCAVEAGEPSSEECHN
jgi:hypothetical protein